MVSEGMEQYSSYSSAHVRACDGVCLAANFVCKYSKVWSLDLAPERFAPILFGSLARPGLSWVNASSTFVIFDHL